MHKYERYDYFARTPAIEVCSIVDVFCYSAAMLPLPAFYSSAIAFDAAS